MKRHYEVMGEREYVDGGYYTPPEPYYPYVVVLAENKRDALVQAARSPEFRDHVRDNRADNAPPFKGMKVTLAVCEHDHCWACSECLTCRAECEDEERRRAS